MLQLNEPFPEAVRPTVWPWQIVVGPSAVTAAVGTGFTVTVTGSETTVPHEFTAVSV